MGHALHPSHQFAAALPTTDLVEHIRGSPYVDDITIGGWTLDEGFLAIPSAPGLGIELDREKVTRFTKDGARLFAPCPSFSPSMWPALAQTRELAPCPARQ